MNLVDALIYNKQGDSFISLNMGLPYLSTSQGCPLVRVTFIWPQANNDRDRSPVFSASSVVQVDHVQDRGGAGGH